MAKKRHHYLPQCYLKGFQNKDERIWTYNKFEPDTPFANAIDSTAVKKYFYRLDIEGREDELEDFFAKEIEGPCAEALKKLRNKEFPNGNERINLATFFSTLFVRTPTYLEHLTIQQNAEFNLYLDVLARQKDEFHKSYMINHPTLSEDQIEQDRQAVLKGEIKLESNKDLVLMLMLKAGATYASYLASMKWVLFETTDDFPIITSDNPMWVTHRDLAAGSYYQPGLAMEGTRISIPVSKKLILQLFNEDRVLDGNVISIEKANSDLESGQLTQLIASINDAMYLNSYKYVFSDTDGYKSHFKELLDLAKEIETINK